jgi:hypothetical protein
MKNHKQKYPRQPADYAPPTESREERDPYDFREIFKLYGWLIAATSFVYLFIRGCS